MSLNPDGFLMPGSPHDLMERIHASGCRCVLSLTGGGSRSIGDLLTVPGASATVLEARVPYAQSALEEWLGGKVDQACSEATARAMAMAGFTRARTLSAGPPNNLRGIAATASLATTRPKRGPHRVHAAWQSASTTVAYSCELAKGRRSRIEEEKIAADLVLHAVAESCGLTPMSFSVANLAESISRREKIAPKEWAELLLGKRLIVREGNQTKFNSDPRIVFPGAFNPLHSGHCRMADYAAIRYGAPVSLELSITNVDKPPLDFLEIDDGLQRLSAYPVLLTRAATFAEKAAILPGAVFVVGADTIARIGDSKYYGASVERRDAAIAAIASQGCRFLVFGRLFQDQFLTLSDLELSASMRALSEEVPVAEFREDVSSTELRGDF